MIHDFFHTPWPYLELAAVTGACSSLVGGVIARARGRLTPARQRWAWCVLLLVTQGVFTLEAWLSVALGS